MTQTAVHPSWLAFGGRLRTLRLARDITQDKLAACVGVDHTYLSKMEHGAIMPPSSYVIHRLADVLHADESELLCLAGKVPDRLKAMLQENPLLSELVWLLSQKRLPDEVYQQLITIAREEQPHAS